ncbi:DegT/DnrJ/EryC1/StrS family aminotransferase [candidate division KSB1 bacterium]|nr:DegT/DnrJ/EryC1/StrS family aminotransferase [candidate division KSB1 bacterium]RQW06457.1 MAG: DegT/DnrJ/EryC1/StrS family aminotransferase [candidate division KSB1 bacterium]
MPGPGNALIGEEELQQVVEVIQSGHVFRYGDLEDPHYKHKVYTFERELAQRCGVKHALAVTSGSAALICALKAVNLQPGDEVIVPAYTFVATYSSIIFCGGIPVLAEIDESLNINPADIQKRITAKTRVIMPVHMLGNACDMDAITKIADQHQLIVIEDACQANGGSYKGRALGSIGAVGTYSLNIFKTITAGDGGALITNDDNLYTRAFAFHDQGHLPNRAGVEVGARSILGINFRVNELTGAMALAQLRKLDTIIQTLREKKRKFKSLLTDIPGLTFRKLPDPDGECATLCTVIFADADKAADVAEKLGTTTVARSGWHVYANMEHFNRWLAEKKLPHGKGAYPITDDILSRAINLSVGVVDAGLGSAFGINIHSTDSEIEQTAEQFRNCL